MFDPGWGGEGTVNPNLWSSGGELAIIIATIDNWLWFTPEGVGGPPLPTGGRIARWYGVWMTPTPPLFNPLGCEGFTIIIIVIPSWNTHRTSQSNFAGHGQPR